MFGLRKPKISIYSLLQIMSTERLTVVSDCSEANQKENSLDMFFQSHL
jgi:hypothetical protein